MTTTHSLETVGATESHIQVRVSYRIIHLFSEGLYSSPNKAIEELVANSYDALAKAVHVIVPANLEAPDALIWVVDDGISMGSDGLVDLWRIATSSKREPGRESPSRPPIGKFGIGKLATYVLARQLTYVCKQDGVYRAVTMNFAKIDQGADFEQSLMLPVRVLTEDEAMDLLGPIHHRADAACRAIPLFGQDAAPSWTVAIMGNLTGLAQKLRIGRLRWVLSTALPLSSQFLLYLNGELLESSREKAEPLREWAVGRDDGAADRLRLAAGEGVDGSPYVDIPGLGQVRGSARIYADPLTGGKSEGWGRSHGVFVMVRKRLINIDDPLFGLAQLSHGPFVRFWMELHADGLDDVLRSTREGVLQESEGATGLRQYILEKFNEARTFYNYWLVEKERDERLSTRIGATPQSLSRRPLLNAIRGVLDGSLPSLSLTSVPAGLSPDEKSALLARLEDDLASEGGLIKDVRFEALGINAGLAVYDASEGFVRVNLLHPFYANYLEHYHNPEPFELLAVAEILTEAYLLEEGLSVESVRNVIRRRDRFLRELVYSRQLAAPLVAIALRENAADSTGLERAVAGGLSSIGFEVSPIGGKGKPDGIALARLGVRDEDSGERSDYKITYDAKSTHRDRVKAHTVGSGTIARHRIEYGAQHSLVVAPDFEGADGGAVVDEAVQQGITLMTVDDLARLVLVAATRQLGFTRLRELFESCRKPAEAREWIDRAMAENAHPGPLPEILDAIWDLQLSLPEPVKFAAVAHELRNRNAALKQIKEKDITAWMQSLRRLAGGYVSIEADVISLEAPPERILREVRTVSAHLPEPFRQQLIYAGLLAGRADDDGTGA